MSLQTALASFRAQRQNKESNTGREASSPYSVVKRKYPELVFGDDLLSSGFAVKGVSRVKSISEVLMPELQSQDFNGHRWSFQNDVCGFSFLRNKDTTDVFEHFALGLAKKLLEDFPNLQVGADTQRAV